MWPLVRHGGGPALLVAHRGGAKLAGGNVLDGIRRVVELGVDAIEFDIRRTADGTLVVHHAREWNGLLLSRCTYRELRDQGAQFPTLTDVLEAAGERLGLDVELKESGYEGAVAAAVLDSGDPDRVIFTSFSEDAVRGVKRAAPESPVGLLIGRRAALLNLPALLRRRFPFDRAEECGCDFLASSIDLRVTGIISRARKQGMPLLIWSVNDPADVARWLSEPNVIGVVAGSPEALRGRHRR